MNSNTVFPRDIVCLRNISVNTLHKGDDDDDDNNNNKLGLTLRKERGMVVYENGVVRRARI